MRERPRRVHVLFAASAVVASVSRPAVARQVDVTDAAGLSVAIGAAAPGDEIVLADGTYALSGASCSAAGTDALPIVVRAATPLGAHVEFDGVEGFKVSGAHWHFRDLDVRGVCAVDDDCEHAFHVSGNADDFRLEHCRVRDFNAQLKVNAGQVGGKWETPDDGRVAGCEVGDTRGRSTSNPTTKLNIDTGDRWVVSDNYLHDAWKDGGDGVSYLAFMKSGGKSGVFERNLAICSRDTTGGTRIGLSFGGGGTGAQYCAPAFDAGTPCSVEHDGGTLRNNVIVNCSDVGIYLNRAKNTRVLHNTLIATGGVDFRFDTTSGEADGNLLAGVIRARDGATLTRGQNQESTPASDFVAWYGAPLSGDLSIKGDVSALFAKVPARAEVTDDYCARSRPSGMRSLGALEHSLGDCATFPPPGASAPDPNEPDAGTIPGTGGAGNGGSASAGTGGVATAGSANAGGASTSSAGSAGSAGNPGGASSTGGRIGASGGAAGASGGADSDGGAGGPSESGGGCGCRTSSPSQSNAGTFVASLAALILGRARARRRRRT